MLLGRRTSDPFVIESGAPELRCGRFNYRLSPRAGIRHNLFAWFAIALLYRALPLLHGAFLRRKHPLIRLSTEADIIGDIRGGDSFSDIYGLKGFLLGSLPVICVLFARGHIVMLPQTYGPFNARGGASPRILRRSSSSSRDGESIATVSSLIGGRAAADSVPRCRFSWKFVSAEARYRSASSGPGRKPDRISVSAFSTTEPQRREALGLRLDYPAFVVRLVESFLGDEHNRVLLVETQSLLASSELDDRVACRRVRTSSGRSSAARSYHQRDLRQSGRPSSAVRLFVDHGCTPASPPCRRVPASGLPARSSRVCLTRGAGECVVDRRTSTKSSDRERAGTPDAGKIRLELTRVQSTGAPPIGFRPAPAGRSEVRQSSADRTIRQSH
jgi:hypothetical protein